MSKVIGVIAAVLAGLALAATLNFTIEAVASPDKEVNLEDPATPNGMGRGANAVSYGSAP